MSRNEDEAERAEKVEKGTKVRRTLSSLRNRMTGSFNKDKVRAPGAAGRRPRTPALQPSSVSVLRRVRTDRKAGGEAGRPEVEVEGAATAWCPARSPAAPAAHSAARPCRQSMACSA